MALDLKELQKKLDNALETETSESLNKWLKNKRKPKPLIKKNQKNLNNNINYLTP